LYGKSWIVFPPPHRRARGVRSAAEDDHVRLDHAAGDRELAALVPGVPWFPLPEMSVMRWPEPSNSGQ
ncbi:MAG TPA: hypothetical protein VFY91_06390, partial [Microbacterium sp.]|nr:hypothetical protein [Microbacterium sp.]